MGSTVGQAVHGAGLCSGALAEPAHWLIGGRAKKGEQPGKDFGNGHAWNASSAMQQAAPFMRMTGLARLVLLRRR